MASETKTTATTQSGWGSGDARIYNNNVCRIGSLDQWYYAYTYGFRTFIAGDTITGVRIRHHCGWDSGGGQGYFDIQLTNATTRQGTAKTNIAMASTSSCANCGLQTQGDSSDLWGLSASALKTLLNNSNFGVAWYHDGVGGPSSYQDGFEITVYYTPAPPTLAYKDVSIKTSLLSANTYKDVAIKTSLFISDDTYKDVAIKTSLFSEETYKDVAVKTSLILPNYTYVDYFLNIPRSDAVKHPSDLAHQPFKEALIRRGLKR